MTVQAIGRHELRHDLHIAIRAYDLKTFGAQFFDPLRSDQKGDVPAGLCQPTAIIAADCTCTRYEHSHGRLSITPCTRQAGFTIRRNFTSMRFLEKLRLLSTQINLQKADDAFQGICATVSMGCMLGTSG